LVIDAATPQAHDAQDQSKAQQRTTAEGGQETPVDQRMPRLLCDGNDQQCRHRNIVGKANQRVGQRSGQVTCGANDPAGDDDRKHRQNEVCDFQLESPRPILSVLLAHSGTMIGAGWRDLQPLGWSQFARSALSLPIAKPDV
jgi:hypothetical protein